MQVLVNTANEIKGSDALVSRVQEMAEDAIGRFSDQVTRLEIYIADENGPKAGVDDIRCTAEARVAGRPHIAVRSHSSTLEIAVSSALDKLVHALEHSMEKVSSRRDRDRASAFTDSEGGGSSPRRMGASVDTSAPGRLPNTEELDDLDALEASL